VGREGVARIFQGLDRAQLDQLDQSLGVIYENLGKNSPWIRRLAEVPDP
jgi:hypothetical protein